MNTLGEELGPDYEAMLDASEQLRSPIARNPGSIKYDVADALCGRVGHLLKALGEYAADGIAAGYRASDPAWSDVQAEALALREMMDYV